MLYTARYILHRFTPHFTFYNTLHFYNTTTVYQYATVYHTATVYCSAPVYQATTVYCRATVYCAAALVRRISQDLLQLGQLWLSQFFPTVTPSDAHQPDSCAAVAERVARSVGKHSVCVPWQPPTRKLLGLVRIRKAPNRVFVSIAPESYASNRAPAGDGRSAAAGLAMRNSTQAGMGCRRAIESRASEPQELVGVLR